MRSEIDVTSNGDDRWWEYTKLSNNMLDSDDNCKISLSHEYLYIDLNVKTLTSKLRYDGDITKDDGLKYYSVNGCYTHVDGVSKSVYLLISSLQCYQYYH